MDRRGLGLSDAEGLLLALCRRNRSGDVVQEAIAACQTQVRREALLERAADHRVTGLVLRTLEREGVLAALDAPIQKRLRAELSRLERVASFWSMERDRVQSLFERAALDSVVLKGAVLRETLYERPVERQVRDLDVLVPRDQVEGALSVLETAGYRNHLPEDQVAWFLQNHFHIEVIHPTGFVVEVHWGLTRPGRPWQLDPVRFMDRSSPLDAPGGDFRVPSDEDMLLHLASQGLGDQFRKLRRLVDIDRLITRNPDLDWTYVWSSARDGHMEIVTACALQLCHALLGTEVPPDLRRRLGISRMAAAHLALLRPHALVMDPDPGSTGRRLSLRLWLVRGWRARSRILAAPLLDASGALRSLRSGTEPDRPSVRLAAGVRDSARHWLSVLLYQLWLYGRAAGATVRPAARRHARFWSMEPSHG